MTDMYVGKQIMRRDAKRTDVSGNTHTCKDIMI